MAGLQIGSKETMVVRHSQEAQHEGSVSHKQLSYITPWEA